jgi:hypothetical protein
MEALEQRIALEIIVQQDAAQVRVTGEFDAEEVIGFAFEPVGGGPDGDHAVNFRVLAVDAHFQLQQLLPRQRTQVVDGLQMGQHIDAGDATEQIKAELHAQEAADGQQVRAFNIQTEKIAFDQNWLHRLAGNLLDGSQVTRQGGVLIAIAARAGLQAPGARY